MQYSIGSVDSRDFEGDFGTYDASASFTERCRQSLVNKQPDDVLKQVGAIKKLPDATRSSLLANVVAGTFTYDMS